MGHSRRIVVSVVIVAIFGIPYLQIGRSQASTGHPDNQPADQRQRILRSLEPFTVRAEPRRLIVRPGESFEVRLQVINSTQSTRSFQVFNGSWMSHWEANDPRVEFPNYTFGRNYLETKTVEPGKAYEKKISLKLESTKPGETFTFVMGFTPDKSQQTYWSNEIVLQVEEASSSPPEESVPPSVTPRRVLRYRKIQQRNSSGNVEETRWIRAYVVVDTP